MEENKQLEQESFKGLAMIEREIKEWNIEMVLIGGYAVRAFTNRDSWRVTKDMDFVIAKKDKGILNSFLRFKNYNCEFTEFGLRGSRKINKNSIDLHIAVNKIYDVSTGKTYYIPDDFFKKSAKRKLSALFEENKKFELEASVAPLEDCIVMKLMAKRPRDHFDALAIVQDNFDLINQNRLKNICKHSDLIEHIIKRLEEKIGDIKRRQFEEVWKEFTGKTLTMKQQTELRKKLLQILKKLKIWEKT